MRFILLSPPDDPSKNQGPPDPRLMAKIDELGADLTRQGVMREMGGWSTQRVRLELKGGQIRMTDGPFAESKEVVGGYAIVDVASPEEAVALGRRFLEVHREILGPSFELSSEIHRLYTPEDFGAPPKG
jgi:hypothetical protein